MTIQPDHAAMRGAVADVDEALRQLTEARTSADRRVAGLLGSAWTGAAANSFAEAWTDWILAATQVETGLEAMGQLLDALHRDLVAQDDSSLE